MPMSEAHSTLRQSLLPHLIDAVSYNVARKIQTLSYMKSDVSSLVTVKVKLPDEVEYLSGILTGDFVNNTWQGKKESVDFYLTKGVVERIAEKLNLQFDFRAGQIDGLHPGRTAIVSLNGKDIGFIGELHPTLAANNDLKRTYVFELNYDAMMEVSVGYINYEPIPRFPGVTRDIALEVNHEVTSSELLSIIHENGEDILNDTLVFDVYEGEHLEKGKNLLQLDLVI